MKCKLEGITVNYEVLGEGSPIVILHSLFTDHRSMIGPMEPVFKEREGWKRIYPDLPGMGKTPGVDWITNTDQMLDVVLSFTDSVIPDQRFAVAGHGYGSYLARGVLQIRARAMDGLFFLVPYVLPIEQGATRPAHVTLVEDAVLLSEVEQKYGEVFRERYQGRMVVQSQALVDGIVTNGLPGFRIADHEFLAKLYENIAYSFDVDALQQPFPGPTLFLTGRQDSVTGYHDAWGILENYPRGTFAVLDRAGHFVQYEQRDLFNALVNEWLDRVEEFGSD